MKFYFGVFMAYVVGAIVGYCLPPWWVCALVGVVLAVDAEWLMHGK